MRHHHAFLVAVGLYAGPVLACTVEFNEIAYLVPRATNIVTGEVVSVETGTYVQPEDQERVLEPVESLLFRVSEVLKGAIDSETIVLDMELGEPEWYSSCGPFGVGFHGYRSGEHYLLMLGDTREDGSFRGGGRFRQRVIRIPDSGDRETGLTEYVRQAAIADGRPLQLAFSGPIPAVAGPTVDVTIEVSNSLPYPITVTTGPGPRADLGATPGWLRLSLGPEPPLREDRPQSAITTVVPASSTGTITAPFGDYFDFRQGTYGLTGSINLTTTSDPAGPTFGDGWGNFGAEYRFELHDPDTAVRQTSWGTLKSGSRQAR